MAVRLLLGQMRTAASDMLLCAKAFWLVGAAVADYLETWALWGNSASIWQVGLGWTAAMLKKGFCSAACAVWQAVGWAARRSAM